MVVEKIIAWFLSPVFFTVQSSRLESLMSAFEGYRLTRVPLVGINHGLFQPAGGGDDLGLYYFVPKMMFYMNLSISDALLLFWSSVILISFLISMVGFFQLYPGIKQRIIALLFSFLAALLTFLSWDVYVVLGAILLAGVPLFLSFINKKNFGYLFYFFSFLLGFISILSNFIRSHSGTGLLLFLGTTIILTTYLNGRKKAFFFLFLLFGFLSAKVFLISKINVRDQFLSDHQENSIKIENQHPLWHNVYIGFGYLPNPFGIEYSDKVAHEEARRVDSDVVLLSEKYEKIIKEKTIRFIWTNPQFVLKVLFSKAMLISIFFLVFANVGIIFYFRKPLPMFLTVAFFVTLFFHSLFGLFTIPSPKYLLGFLVLSCLFGAVSICNSLQSSNKRINLDPS